MPGDLATSRYTFRLPVADGFALYNASTGAVLRLSGPDADELSAVLSGPPTVVETTALPASILTQMRRNGFLVDRNCDEVAVIRERYWTARGNAPLVLLITTTMECNLGCYYCYESRSGDALRATDVEQIVAIARDRLGRRRKRSLHVDWYGGEPLLNIDLIERASVALQDLCAAEGVGYHASVVSNGTLWPADVGAFVKRHKLRQVQISFDGMRANHDKRRRYRPHHRPAIDPSSFDRAVRLVDRLLQHTRVDVRFNADPGNADDFGAFIAFARSRGWFNAPFRCVLMPARLQPFSERSEFMRRRELTDDEFDRLQELARSCLPNHAQDDQDMVLGFPFPVSSVCGALAPDSAVIGADGLEYRCGLQVGEHERAVGRFGGDRSDEHFQDRDWWNAFDPTEQPNCSRCSFLPICWGGCPKRHLDESRVDIEREGRFWRTNLPRLIADGLGERAPAGFTFSEHDQFRTTT